MEKVEKLVGDYKPFTPFTDISKFCHWVFALQLLPLAILIVKNAPWTTGDSGLYIRLADFLSREISFGLGNETSFESEGWRLPGYPLFTAASRLVASYSNHEIVLAQVAPFLASVWFIYKVAVRAFVALTCLVFLAFSAVYPFIAFSACQISPETPVVFLVSFAFFLLSDHTARRVALAALLIGLSADFRPNLILLNFALAAALVLMNRRSHSKAPLMIIIAIVTAFPGGIKKLSPLRNICPVTAIRGTGNCLLLATWQSKISIPSLMEYGTKGNLTSEVRSSGMADRIGDLNRRLGVPENMCLSPLNLIQATILN